MNYLIVLIAAMIGGFTQTVTGFGAGIVIMLFLPYILSVMQASALSTMITMILNITLVYHYRKSIKLKYVAAPAIISFVFSTAAIKIGKNLDLHIMKIVFSLFLIALAIYFIFFSDKIKLKPTLPTVLTCAGLAGTAGGLFGIGGPPMALYYLTITANKQEYIGTTQAFFLVSNVYTTMVRVMNHVVDQNVLSLFLPGLIGVMIGEILGNHYVDHISHQKMKKMIYIFLEFSGLLTLFQCF